MKPKREIVMFDPEDEKQVKLVKEIIAKKGNLDVNQVEEINDPEAISEQIKKAYEKTEIHGKVEGLMIAIGSQNKDILLAKISDLSATMNIDSEQLDESLNYLKHNGTIYESSKGIFRII